MSDQLEELIKRIEKSQQNRFQRELAARLERSQGNGNTTLLDNPFEANLAHEAAYLRYLRDQQNVGPRMKPRRLDRVPDVEYQKSKWRAIWGDGVISQVFDAFW